MYTLTIIRISNGMFRSTLEHSQVNLTTLRHNLYALPAKEDVSIINYMIEEMGVGKSRTLTLHGMDENQHWNCYISRIS